MSDFKGEDYEFAAGSILGLRSWGMDAEGRLHGVTHREVWRPGENVAVCKTSRRVVCPEVAKSKANKVMRRGDIYHYEVTFSPFVERDPCGKHPDCRDGTHPAPNDHTFDPNCECGFWAYDEHAFTSHGDVTGIIEGYGKTTIGTRGFRCEKARIVALSREHDLRPLSLSSWLRLQQLYPEAAFYEDVDEMVSRHGGVLKAWPAVDDDFWGKPVKRRDDEFSMGGFVTPGTLTINPSAFKWSGRSA